MLQDDICEALVALLDLCVFRTVHNFYLSDLELVVCPLQGEKGPVRPELGTESMHSVWHALDPSDQPVSSLIDRHILLFKVLKALLH